MNEQIYFTLRFEISLYHYFLFTDSSRRDVRKEKAIEKARDSELVVKLVIIYRDGSTKSLATMSLPVWIKVKLKLFVKNDSIYSPSVIN